MSDCDWLGMDVFGTQFVSPGPSELPSTVLLVQKDSVEQVVTLTQAADNTFVTVLKDGTNPLSVTLARSRKTHAVILSVHVTGRVTSGLSATADLAARVIVGTNTSIFTRPGDGTNFLLVRKVRVPGAVATDRFPFAVGYSVLVPPEVLPDSASLQFRVQLALQGTGIAGSVMTLDPKADALVAQEIGPAPL
jgi:hypothetical protein